MSTDEDTVTVPLRDLPGILRECLRSGLLAHGFTLASGGLLKQTGLEQLARDLGIMEEPGLSAASERERDAFLCTVANNVAQILVGRDRAER